MASRRLNIDLDEKAHGALENIIEKIFDIYENAQIEYRRSSGGNWHIRTNIEIKESEILKIRRQLGDCRGRIIADTSRQLCGLNYGRLFGLKSVYDTTNAENIKVKISGRWRKWEKDR